MRATESALIGAIFLCPLPAAAGPPFETDDPEPVDQRHWEFYVASQVLRQPDGTTGTAPHFEYNYGALPDLQLHIIAPIGYARPEGGETHHGLGDIELGAKLRFVDETPSRPMVGTFPQVELPTGDADRGLGSGHTQFFIPLWLQKSFGPWTTYGGGGYWVNPGAGNKNWWFTGWLLQRRLSHLTSVGAEIIHTTSDTIGGRGDLRFNAGVVLDPSDNHHLLFCAGRSIDGDVRFHAYFAYQLTI